MKRKRLLGLLTICLLVVTSCKKASDSGSLILSTDSQPSQVTSDRASYSVSENESVPDPYDGENWPASFKEKMRKYLNGNLLPYIPLGRYTHCGYETTDSDYGCLDITSEKELTLVSRRDIEAAFLKEGWVSGWTSDTTYEARLEGRRVHVKIRTDTFDCIEILASYDEPFDPSRVSDWDDDVRTIFHNHMEGNAIPYVYLGSKFPSPTWNEYGQFLKIAGGPWNKEVLSLAQTAYKDWNLVSLTDTSVSFTYTGEDKSTYSLSVSKGGTDNFPKCVLQVYFTGGYNPGSQTTWDPTVLKAFDDHLDSHEIPYVYLSTTYPTISWNLTTSKLMLIGKTWHDGIYDDALRSFQASTGWILTEGTDINGRTLTGLKDYDDGCTIKAVLNRSSGDPKGVARLTMTYYEKLTQPATVDDYSENTLEIMAEHLDGHRLPYIYLNTLDEHPYWDNDKHALFLTGGEYNYHLIPQARKAFEDDGFEVTETEDTNGRLIKAVKSFDHDGAEPCQLTVFFRTPMAIGARCLLTAYFKEGYGVNRGTDWPNGIRADIKYYFDQDDLPYLYLGTERLTTEYDSTLGVYTISGGTFDSRYIEESKTMLQSEGYETSTSDSQTPYPTLYATKTTTEGDTISITISAVGKTSDSYYYKPVELKIRVVPHYELPKETGYSDTVGSLMADAFDDHTIPYLYLGKTPGTETATYQTSTHRLTVTGLYFYDELLTNAKDVLNKDGGWVIQDGSNTYNRLVKAYKTNDDGSYFMLRLYQQGLCNEARAYLDIIFDPALTFRHSGFDAVTAKTLSDNLDGEAIPYFDMGSDTVTASVNPNLGFVSLTAGTTGNRVSWNNGYLYHAKTVFDEAGWDTEIDIFQSAYGGRLEAVKETADGRLHLYFACQNQASSMAYLTFERKWDYPEDGSWSSPASQLMLGIFGSRMPYIYLGPSMTINYYSYENQVMEFRGNGYDESLFDRAITSLENDTDHNWTTYDDFSYPQYGRVLSANAVDDLGKTITLKLYVKSDTTYGTRIPMLQVVREK